MIYVAFIRGIGPGDPKRSNKSLLAVFNRLGFKESESLLGSGNIIFQSGIKDAAKLERNIDKALRSKLGINGVFVRSQDDIEKIIKKDPFKGAAHGGDNYLIVTFLKEPPYEIYTSLTREEMRTPKFMAEIDKKYKKNATTRTWKTVGRVLNAMKGSA